MLEHAKGSEEPVFRADATFYIEAATHDEAQTQLEDLIAEHMPSNFVVGWTLTEDDSGPAGQQQRRTDDE